MKRLLLRAPLSLAVTLAAGVVYGSECTGVSFPEELATEGGALRLNGLGLRQATFLKVDVYVAALYLVETSTNSNAVLGSNTPRELILHFVRDVDRGDLNKAWEKGFENNAGDQIPELRARIDAFKQSMTDVRSGQRLRLAYRPGAGVRVDVDDQGAVTIPGDDFARALFSIWLGDKPPNAGLKTGLLGGPCE